MFKEIGEKTAARVKDYLKDGEFIFIEDMQAILRKWNENYRYSSQSQLEFNFYRGGCPTCD